MIRELLPPETGLAFEAMRALRTDLGDEPTLVRRVDETQRPRPRPARLARGRGRPPTASTSTPAWSSRRITSRVTSISRPGGVRYRVPVASIQRASKTSKSAEAVAEAVRMHRLREDARRPMSVNLAEGIALSHKLMRFVGATRLH